MLLIAQTNRRSGGSYSVVTVVNGPEDNTWRTALGRGYVFTPPPLWLTRVRRRRVGILGSVAAVARENYDGHGAGGFLTAVRAAHRARIARAQDEYERAIMSWTSNDRRYERARQRARENHLRRYR
jgi:hypothetical protein